MKLPLDPKWTALLLALALLGCEGDPGRAGISRLPEDLYPPTAEIILPLASRPLFERAIIEVLVKDDDSLARTTFLVDGLPAAVGSITEFNPPTQYLWNCASLPLGMHSLQVVAIDQQNKVGQSAMLYLNRAERIPDEIDTLRLFDDDSTKTVKWKIPTDSLGTFRGLATRFTPDQPVKVLQIGLRVFRKVNWKGAKLYLDLMSVRDGLPDTITARDSLILRESLENKDNELWATSSRFRTILIPGEFILAVHQADDHAGDTLSVLTDDGLWKNGHGLVLTSDGVWRPFSTGRGLRYNPLIFAKVRYQ